MNSKRIISYNKRARYNYHIEGTYEAGIALYGNEVKAIRDGQINIHESFIGHKKGELFLKNCNITKYKFDTNSKYYDPIRERRLLLHRGQIKKIASVISQKGYASFVLSCYFNKRNILKLEIGYGKGKKEYDKRAAIKEREWRRTKAKILKEVR